MACNVFLSHSNAKADQPLIDELEQLSKLAGMNLYIAERKPEYEKRISQKIIENLESARSVLVLMTKDAAKSQFVGNEVGYAVKAEIPVVSILEEGVPLTGVRYGFETIGLSRKKPSAALTEATQYIKDKICSRKATHKESRAVPKPEPLSLKEQRRRTRLLLNKAEERFASELSRRFASHIEFGMEHRLFRKGGLTLLECHLTITMDLEPSKVAETWRYTAGVDQSVAQRIASMGLRLDQYKIGKVAVQGMPVPAVFTHEDDWHMAKYECELQPGKAVRVEIDYSFLCWPEDVYIFTVTRFARSVRLSYKKNPRLEYNAVETGVATPIQPTTKGPFKGIVHVERTGLIFPGWGYIVSWRRKA